MNLTLSDLDILNRCLYVPGGKGIADRTVWFSLNTQIVLKDYLDWRSKFNRISDRFFIYDKVAVKSPYALYSKNFRTVAIDAKLRSSKKGRDRSNFTIHDLRHSYTVKALIEIYKSNLNIHECVIELSANLGHGSIKETYWYVEAVPELTAAADLPLLGGPPFKLEFGGYGPPCWVDRNEV